MKKIYATIGILSLCFGVNAQTTVKKTPLYELFTSSTCPPCRPANEHLTPQFEARENDAVVIKYQMSWPGSGDPYYTLSGNTRRNYYAVNSVPSFFRNATGQPYADFDTTEIDQDLTELSSMKMELRYMIDADSQKVAIKARIEALDDFTAPAQRLIIAITERVNYANFKTNGETEFHDVFKKMLPTTQGEFIIGAISTGDTFLYDFEYDFKGDYRLPNNSSDLIDDEIEHSVEDFNNLHVVMFMQSAESSKEIFQAANGEHSSNEEIFNRPWGEWITSVEEINASSQFLVYPNPTNTGQVRIESKLKDSIKEIKLFSVTGSLIKTELYQNVATANFATTNIASGIYFMKVISEGGEFVQEIAIQN